MSFSVEGEFDYITVIPNNFFSALLYQGILFPPAALFGIKSFKTDYGIYYWEEGVKWDNKTDPGKLYFQPDKPAEYIEVNIKIN